MAKDTVRTTCCVVGGGPAGVMLGLLLARKGVRVTVLEKHKDFFRDFRGDTVHPSTLDAIHDLGLLEEFLQVPHQELTSAGGVFGDFNFRAATFEHVPARCKFVALMPQWDLLSFLAGHAKRYSGFDLRLEHEAVGLLEEDGRITGVKVNAPEGTVEVHARLVVGCDGRHAMTRQAAGLQLQEYGVPIDVLWFRLSRNGGDPEEVFGNINYGKLMILIPRGDYFQAGLIIRKGSFNTLIEAGIDAFRATLLKIAPFLGNRVEELQDWEQIKLLSVQINRLRSWHRPGLLCIGDAAHAMSPVGGVGINLAIQDSIATANLFARPLLDGGATDALSEKLQCRRELPTRLTQFAQVNAHKMLEHVFAKGGRAKAPWQMKLVLGLPGVQRLLGRLIGMGVRPERVHEPQGVPRIPKRVLFAAAFAGAAVGLAIAPVLRSRSRRGEKLRIGVNRRPQSRISAVS